MTSVCQFHAAFPEIEILLIHDEIQTTPTQFTGIKVSRERKKTGTE
jgi:hypothetical protein